MAQFNRATLAKILEILSSDHSGEVMAAANLATTMVRESGLSWEEILREDLQARSRAQPARENAYRASAPGYRPSQEEEHTAIGPLGIRRNRDYTSFEQFFMLLLSARTPSELKRELRSWEPRVLDGDISPQERQDLQHMFRQFVAA
jgi:hypothetical protein